MILGKRRHLLCGEQVFYWKVIIVEAIGAFVLGECIYILRPRMEVELRGGRRVGNIETVLPNRSLSTERERDANFDGAVYLISALRHFGTGFSVFLEIAIVCFGSYL